MKKKTKRKAKDIKVGLDYAITSHACCINIALAKLERRKDTIMAAWEITGDDKRAVEKLETLAGNIWLLAERLG